MKSTRPISAFVGPNGAVATKSLGLVLAVIISFLGLVAVQANVAQAADPTAPVKAPLINELPLPLTTETTAVFTFGPGNGETQSVTGYVCRFDTEVFTPCSSPQNFNNVAVGDHFFGVKATNAIGNGPEATYSWSVDPVLPDAAVLGDLLISPTNKAVQSGKKTNIKVSVENIGDAPASGAKACASTKSKQIAFKKCQSIGSIGLDQIVSKTFSVYVNEKAKKGKKAVLTFTATASGAEKVTAKATITFK